ncbi:hypothetical protein [Streptomyces sp. SUK 48]|uniref:hypothetical protein n=1 Tax=Streptomyces sp. SUK 48 TaxID=2582831 RepID=UPI00129BE990|nr:hypothetical protein [Streptomyces sp. SUK 48]
MTVILPSAQSLVTAMLTDGWASVRTFLASRWSRQTQEPQDAIEERLDAAHAQAAEVTTGDTEQDRAFLRAYWAGYLTAAVAQHPALGDLVRDLYNIRTGAGTEATSSVHNTNNGTVTNLVQGRDFSGGITFGAQ